MDKTLSTDDNVIDLASIRFPVGSKVWHPNYRICHVVESIGNQRKIKIVKLGTLEMVWNYALVHVNELQKLVNPIDEGN